LSKTGDGNSLEYDFDEPMEHVVRAAGEKTIGAPGWCKSGE
jgi:hypothetical protein